MAFLKHNLKLTGLGALARLEDQILLQVLGQLPAEALACLAVSSKSLYCFANHEDLWRHMTLQVKLLSLTSLQSMCDNIAHRAHGDLIFKIANVHWTKW